MDPERGEPGPDEADVARARRALLRLVPIALLLFLGTIALGFVPRLLADRSPGLARAAAIGVWLVLPVLAVAMVANVLRRLARLRRRGCEREPPP